MVFSSNHNLGGADSKKALNYILKKFSDIANSDSQSPQKNLCYCDKRDGPKVEGMIMCPNNDGKLHRVLMKKQEKQRKIEGGKKKPGQN